MHQPAPAPATGTMEKVPRATVQAGSLSEHQFCIWDGFVEKVGFEFGLTLVRFKEVELGKEDYKSEDDHGQRAEMQNKECLDDSEGIPEILIIFKTTFRKGFFSSSTAFCFSKCPGTLSSTYHPKFKNESMDS